MRAKLLLPVVIYAILNAGCATNYSPREPGRIHFVLNYKGEEAIEKDGQKYPLGGYSGGQLPAAVKGNAAAEQYAQAYVDRQEASSLFAIAAGIAFVVAGFLFIGATAERTSGAPDEHREDHRGALMIGMGVASLVGIGTSIGAVINGEAAQRNLYDAINTYNDGVAKRAP